MAQPPGYESRPAVSVVIVVHNDAEHLVHAVASARRQSLDAIEILVVDDCSDDDTFEVASRLGSEDPRIRVLRTPRNSGGPGAPRNVGLDHAVAPWVTFLDSDDLLEPDAVRHLLAAAERDAADVVCGMTRRVFLDGAEPVDWHAELFAEPRTLESITEMLDLVVVTTATAKLYRGRFLTENGLRFSEDMHYEDLIFSAQVFAAARGITTVSERVYVWNVYSPAERTSITQMREEETNLQDRLSAVSRVEEIAAESGKVGLLERYQLKFLQHDAHLYLRDLVRMSDDAAARVLVVLEPAIRHIPETVFGLLSVHDRLVYGVALCGSVDGVRELKPALKGHVTLEGRTISSAGRILWTPSMGLRVEPAPGTLEHRLLDVTGDAILETPFREIAYGHRVSSIVLDAPDAAIVRGQTADPFRRLAGTDVGRAEAVAVLLDHGARFTWPVQVLHASGQKVEWEFRLQLPRSLPLVRPQRLELALEFHRDGESNRSAIWLQKGAEVPRLLPPRGSLRAALRQWYSFSRVGAGKLTLKLSEPHGRRGRIDLLVHRLAARRRTTASE